MNTPPTIVSATSKRLHLQKGHPVALTRQLIESRFPGYRCHNDLFPVVTTAQNFDSLFVPSDHISRKRTDTYYINEDSVLRTHTSAHQADIFRANLSKGFLISADVYRRDAVDRTHYPIFHQMEGARVWDREELGSGFVNQVWNDVEALPKHDMVVEDPNPSVHPERNPLQSEHKLEEVDAVATHLKRSVESVVVEIFSKAKQAQAAAGDAVAKNAEPLRVRWVETYFPFTSPSWELEIFWKGDWLEVLGCGVILQDLLKAADVPSQVGWAFGIGLERIAMLLFNIPDIRLFWSQDARFLSQFAEDKPVQRFMPFSKHPGCYKDVSFWLPSPKERKPSDSRFHENDLMEIVRSQAGDLVESVTLADEFIHPKTQRESKLYRINYRSLERTLTNSEVNELHSAICNDLVKSLGVKIR